jgi:hypothetical protein
MFDAKFSSRGIPSLGRGMPRWNRCRSASPRRREVGYNRFDEGDRLGGGAGQNTETLFPMMRSLTVLLLAFVVIAASTAQAGVPGAYKPGSKPKYEPGAAPPKTYRPQGARPTAPATYRPSSQPGPAKPTFSPRPQAPKKSYTPPAASR